MQFLCAMERFLKLVDQLQLALPHRFSRLPLLQHQLDKLLCHGSGSLHSVCDCFVNPVRFGHVLYLT